MNDYKPSGVVNNIKVVEELIPYFGHRLIEITHTTLTPISCPTCSHVEKVAKTTVPYYRCVLCMETVTHNLMKMSTDCEGLK